MSQSNYVEMIDVVNDVRLQLRETFIIPLVGIVPTSLNKESQQAINKDSQQAIQDGKQNRQQADETLQHKSTGPRSNE